MTGAPRRILMTADTVGGVWTYALELVAALETHGVEVLLATMGRAPTDAQRRQASALANLRLVASDYALEWMSDPWADVHAAGRWLLDLAARYRPDIVHLNNYVHGKLPWEVPVVVVGHSCVTSWFAAVRGMRPPSEFDRYRQAVRQGLHAANLVVAPTQSMLNTLDRDYGPLPEGLVIPNGVRPGHFFERDKEPFILSAGRLWDEAKNISVLRDIAPQLAWPVHVAGDATHPEGGSANLGSVVTLGSLSRDAVIEQMSKAAIYAMPARYEPFGLSPLEAALCGCALVLGDIPSLREVWGSAAVFVPPDDQARWRAAFEELIENPERRQALAQAAFARAQRYDASTMGQRYMQAYQTLLARTVDVRAARASATLDDQRAVQHARAANLEHEPSWR